MSLKGIILHQSGCFLELSPLVEQGQQLPCVIQVIARHPAEAERVQVAKGDRRERHDRGRDLVHSGDVRVLQVELDPVHAHEQQEGERAQADQEPEAALDAAALVRENVSDSVQGRSVRENFNGWRSTRVHVFGFYFEIHSAAVQQALFECQSVRGVLNRSRWNEPAVSSHRCGPDRRKREIPAWTWCWSAITQADWRKNISRSLCCLFIF